MCGIAGIINLDGKKVDQKILHAMDVALAHRGPDGHGELVYQNVGLANRRLAIIDPTPAGRQPMSTLDENYWITFNGEIFNYEELRRDLIENGYELRSHTDTETVLYGYKHYGEKFVEKLIGHFAFCIWDKNREKFFLARDQMGVNPLFYARIGKTFIFASEVKALLASGLIKREINPQALHHYLSMFAIPSPLTIFESAESLLPGHIMTVEKKGVRKRKYWELPVGLWRNGQFSEEDLREKLRELLISAVSYAKVADVPVAAFLSGGIDSSTVVAIMAQQVSKPIKTFSLWSQGSDWFDEREYARLIAERYHTDHTEFTVTQDDLVRALPKIVYYFDQPTGGSLEGYLISQMAGREVKVALSGLGGDELFAGYNSILYQTKSWADLYRHIPLSLRQSFLSLVNFLPFSSDLKKTIAVADKLFGLPNIFKRRLYLYFAYQEDEKRQLYDRSYLSKVGGANTDVLFDGLYQKVKSLHPVDQLSFTDLNTYTRDDLLLGLNMMSMANSLEARVPFLDPRLVEFAAKIPPAFKFRNGVSKYILKEAVKVWLPEEVITHRKTGFGIPRVQFMKGILKPYITSALSLESVKKRGIFNPVYVKKALDMFYSSGENKMLWSEHLRIWTLFIFELWCRLYIDQNRISPPSHTLKDMLDS